MNDNLAKANTQPPAAAGSPIDVDRVISRILRAGVLASAAIIVTGLILFLSTGGGGYPDGAYPTRLPDMFRGLAALKPNAVILIGLFCLILTPVMRVGISIIVFLLEKDYIYVLISSTVFVILILSMFFGIHG